MSIKLSILGLCLSLPAFLAPPAWGAQRIFLTVGPVDVSLSVEALEIYATQGIITPEFATYAGFLEPQQLESLRRVLVQPAEVSPVDIAQFFYSPQGEIILQRVGEVIQTKAQQNGFFALRSALILAAAEEEGLTLLNVLKKFPTFGIRINSQRGFEILRQLSGITEKTQGAIAQVEQQSVLESLSLAINDFSILPDLRLPGSLEFEKQTLTLEDTRRERLFPTDLYLPQLQERKGLLPLVIISHGLGSDRKTFAYLATHLASYGFAVAVLEHPGSSASQIQALRTGLASEVTPPQELIDRPLDIKYLLDELTTSFGQVINTQQVGVIGQSFGGYTTLALAGAQVNLEELPQDCPPPNTLNLSLLVQCLALDLSTPIPKLADERVVAAIAINPLASIIFGESQISQIKVPTMLVSGSADTVTPTLPEQMLPFTWLAATEKYLVLFDGGTHFSTLGESESGNQTEVIPVPAAVIGPDPTIAQAYVKALALAFFQSYVANKRAYEIYLNADYAQNISQTPMPLYLLQFLSQEQLENNK